MDKIILFGTLIVVFLVYVLYEIIHRHKLNDAPLYGSVKLICQLKGGDFDDGGDWLCEFEIDGKMASGVVYINDANAKPGDIHQGFYDGLSVSIPCIFLQEEDDEDMNE